MKMKTIQAASVAAAIALFGAPAQAAVFDIMIGDNDGYGQGLADGAEALDGIRDFGADQRDAFEQVATDGSEQTDINSALFAPVDNPANFTFNLAGDILSAVFTIDIGGLQLNDFGETLSFFNGVNVGILALQQGVGNTDVLSFALTAAQIADVNAVNSFTFTMDRNGNSDAVFIDYLSFAGEYAIDVVPLPAALPLMLAGLGGLGFAGRKRRKSA